jgi:hypothetical protein
MALRTRALVARQKKQFLAEFRQRGDITASARAVGIARTTPYKWRKHDAAFDEAFRDAEEEVSDALEGEAFRRAMGQVEVPVYHHGEVVGHIRRYSDGLLMFLLRARRPERYRERCEHRVVDSDPRPLFPLEEARAAMEAAGLNR